MAQTPQRPFLWQAREPAPIRPAVEPTASESPSLARARLVNEACERFEAAWRAGLQPNIEDELGRAISPDPPELLTELVGLEVELRQERAEQPSLADYLARFPERSALIRAAFANQPLLTGQQSCAATRVDPGGVIPGDDVAGTVAEPVELRGSLAGLVDFGPDFADFELIEEVARGGMGIVYKARKRSLNRLVALKVMQSGPLASSLEKRRFLLEAEVAASLDHPNIVPVHEIDRARGLFFTMKWVEGASLTQQIPQLVGDRVAAVRLLATVARAVHAAHGKGYLHRDLKPANILVDPQGKPYLIDFGLALRVSEDSNLTQPGAVLGTPGYMAPEQAAGKGLDVGPTADVYSLGAVFYELLTGQAPFKAGTVMETLVLVIEKDPVPPSRLRPEIPPELEAICLKCLEKDPQDRYPSAACLANELEQFLRGEAVEAMHAGKWLRVRRWTRQEPQLVTHLLALAAFEVLTQINFVASDARHLWLHLEVSASLALWALAALVLQMIARRERWRVGVRSAWAVADTMFLTVTLWLLDGVTTSMVVGFPLLVAVAGLWFHVGLIWLTTILAEVGYCLLIIDSWLRDSYWNHDHHPNVVIATIAVTGFVVARQVKRLLVLSSYYENR